MRIAAIIFAVWSGQAAAQLPPPLPDPIDLQAAYCLGALDQGIRLSNASPPSNDPQGRAFSDDMRAQYQAKRTRLFGYLAPRTAYLDVMGLATARNQGVADYQTYMSGFTQCANTCSDKTSCMTCVNSIPILGKLSRCQSLDFLPY